jgi:hypothetical protein
MVTIQTIEKQLGVVNREFDELRVLMTQYLLQAKVTDLEGQKVKDFSAGNILKWSRILVQLAAITDGQIDEAAQ